MQIGRLRNRVTIQRNAGTQAASGQTGEDWQDVFSRWAEVRNLGGGESLRGQQVQAGVTTIITIRFAAGVTAEMRVLYGTRIFHIEAAIDPDERRRELQLHCREIPA